MESTEVLFNLACSAYDSGEFEKAFKLFSLAAEQGDSSAMSRIALMYGDGEGVDYDFDKSVYWDRKAIDNGCLSSMTNLAITYRDNGFTDKAKLWFGKAVDAGDQDAVIDLVKLLLKDGKEKKIAAQMLSDLLDRGSVYEDVMEQAKQLLDGMK